MNAGHASLIARLDEKLQKDAVEYTVGHKDSQYHETPTTSELREWIQERVYAEAMKSPPWKGDQEAQAVFEGCEECRGKGTNLFGKGAAEACSNPNCYAQRAAAYIALQLAKSPELVKLSGNYSNDDDLIGRSSYHEIAGRKDGCDHQESGIVVSGEGLGHKKVFCRAPECEKHWVRSAPGGHYKPTKQELAARKKQREDDAKKKAAADKRVLEAVAKVKWPMSEKHLDVLFDLVFRRFGYSYLQPVATRHGVKAVKTKRKYGYMGRDLEKPLVEMAEKNGKTGKLQLIFEIALETQGSDVKVLKNL
jgi:hypothetical protein